MWVVAQRSSTNFWHAEVSSFNPQHFHWKVLRWKCCSSHPSGQHWPVQTLGSDSAEAQLLYDLVANVSLQQTRDVSVTDLGLALKERKLLSTHGLGLSCPHVWHLIPLQTVICLISHPWGAAAALALFFHLLSFAPPFAFSLSCMTGDLTATSLRVEMCVCLCVCICGLFAYCYVCPLYSPKSILARRMISQNNNVSAKVSPYRLPPEPFAHVKWSCPCKEPKKSSAKSRLKVHLVQRHMSHSAQSDIPGQPTHAG